MSDASISKAREALVCACLLMSIGQSHRDKIRIVFEDALAALPDGQLTGMAARLADLARSWLAATDERTRRAAEQTIGWITHERFLHRMADAHADLRPKTKA